jgi:hypothetical protein
VKKSPRTWNRREFDIKPAGYFTVTKATGWFAAWRLPGGFRYLFPQSREAKELQDAKPEETPANEPAFTSARGQMANDNADSQQTAVLSQSVIPGRSGHWLMRLVLIVFAAAAITYALLWWIARAHP